MQHAGEDFLRGVLVLLRHKRRTALPLLFNCAQQGQRVKVLAIAMAILSRMVAIEFGTWRWVRTGSASGSVTFGNGSFFEAPDGSSF